MRPERHETSERRLIAACAGKRTGSLRARLDGSIRLPGNGVGKLTLVLAAAVLAICASAAEAAEQSIAALMDAAAAHLRDTHDASEGELTVQARAPDSRLHLIACAQPLSTDSQATRASGPVASVRVSCADPAPWSVNVLLDLKLERDVLVAARGLRRGVVLDAADVQFEHRDVLRLPYGYLGDPARLEGMRLSRSVANGTTLNPGMLAERLLVERGHAVTIVARSGSIAIRAGALAMEDGIAGERVRVRNLASGRVVNGVVESTGIVVVSE